MYHLSSPCLFFSGRRTIGILSYTSFLSGRYTIHQTPIFFLYIFIRGRCTICHSSFSYASFFEDVPFIKHLLLSYQYFLLRRCTICQTSIFFSSGKCTILILLYKSLL